MSCCTVLGPTLAIIFALIPLTVPVNTGLFLGALAARAGPSKSLVACDTATDKAFATAMLFEISEELEIIVVPNKFAIILDLYKVSLE